MTRRSSRMPSHPRRPKRGRVPAPPPTLGPLITRPGRARHQHLARGSRLGQRAEPEGKGERERRGRRPRPGGCLEPRATHARPPRCGQERAGPQAGETPGPRRAAPEPFATCPAPSGHRLASRRALDSRGPTRRGRLGRAPSARPRCKQLGSVGGWLGASLRGAPPPSRPGVRSSHLLLAGGRPSPGPGGSLGGSGAAAAGARGPTVRPAAAAGIRGHAH